MAVGSFECSRPSAWPSSWTATRNKSLPRDRKGEEGQIQRESSPSLPSSMIKCVFQHFVSLPSCTCFVGSAIVSVITLN